jgi:prefoldin subunit 5
MADQQLNIKLNVIDNASKAFSQIKDSIFNVRNALIGLGAGFVVKDFIDIGKATEDVRARLNQLSKSGYGGSQAFDQLTQFAIKARIPLLDVLQASGDLLSVAKSPEELAKKLEQSANAAAYFKISFSDAADQIAKGLLKGTDSARLFQDKGIKSIQGFGEYADKSFNGFNQSLEKAFGARGKFGTANDDLKKGLAGSTIAIQNFVTAFEASVSKGFFTTLTKQLNDLDKYLQKNGDSISKFAEQLGSVLADALVGFGKTLIFIKDNFVIFFDILAGAAALKALDYLRLLTQAFFGLALVAAANPFTAIAAGIAISAVLIWDNLDWIIKKFESFKDTIKNLKWSDLNPFNKSNTKEAVDNITEISQCFEDTLMANLKQFGADSQILNFQNVLNGVFQKNKNNLSDLEKQMFSLDGVTKTISDGLQKGIEDFSLGVAKSIVLGEKLGVTFRKIVDDILVRLISKQLEYIATLLLDIAYQKIKTTELYAQLAASMGSSLSGAGSFLSSIFGGGGGGGMTPIDASVVTPFAEGGSVRGGMPITVGERGRELFVPSTNGTIVPNHDLGMGSNFTFNIQANDVRGIRELLIDNRATIINLVNQSANQKGKSNVV